ncbi:MAG TPA: erythromycin esterase family protein [Thermoanaerobaculia bacterium]|nr:erythromycin esterase family protein [Thermoanaerobaculia bacterium]
MRPMLRRAGSLVLALSLLALTLDAAPRRRAVSKCCSYDESTPAGWLSAHASVLISADLNSYSGDLSPLSSMIGNSDVVGLGDISHGTHELYTMKLRLIDHLVREKGFDVVALEAPFPIMNRINAYVQGGPGDARAMLREMRALQYPFWDAEELVAVVEWMREYNAHRGDRVAVQIAGFDVLEAYPASRSVLEYLNAVDPVYAVTAQATYQCVMETTLFVNEECRVKAVQVREGLAGRETELTARSSATAFQEALHNARVVVQSRYPFGQNRDNALAENALWLREYRGSTGKMILWAHSAHVSKNSSSWGGVPRPMGMLLAESLGDEYFSLTTLIAQGTYRHWIPAEVKNGVKALPPLQPTSYETYIRQRGVPFLLIPLRGTLPSWLTAAAPYNVVGTTSLQNVTDPLAPRYDAVIFIDATTPLQAIPD